MTDEEQITERAAKILGLTRNGPDGKCWLDSKGYRRDFEVAFDPLHNIAHAWMLVEKMREMPWELQWRFELLIRGCWADAVTRTPPFLWLTPAAITRAALEAVSHA